MQFWPALFLGLLGSLHCAGMCGPLALSLPIIGGTRLSSVGGSLAYNLGRLTTYFLLGGLFGAMGLTFALTGFQRWASISAGIAILLGLAASSRYAVKTPVSKIIGGVRCRLAPLLRKRSYGSVMLLGVLNGFLPCGLVYVACAGAIATRGILAGGEYMLMFGLGTVPMMLSIGLIGKILRVGARLRIQRLIPVYVLILAVLLVLRGLSLGIPYLSPSLTNQGVHCAACRSSR